MSCTTTAGSVFKCPILSGEGLSTARPPMNQPPKPTSPVRPRFHSIDVLRGVAALSVVVYHLWLRYFPGQSTQAHLAEFPADHRAAFLLTFPIQYGYFGVTLFFVLSGFCIHLPQAWRF